MLMPIHVLSRDGQSILESRDTLTGGLSVLVPPCTVPGLPEYLGISGYSDRGVKCACGLSCDGQSNSGCQDTLTEGRGQQCACGYPCTVPG